jgi:hypothetical protein
MTTFTAKQVERRTLTLGKPGRVVETYWAVVEPATDGGDRLTKRCESQEEAERLASELNATPSRTLTEAEADDIAQ